MKYIRGTGRIRIRQAKNPRILILNTAFGRYIQGKSEVLRMIYLLNIHYFQVAFDLGFWYFCLLCFKDLLFCLKCNQQLFSEDYL